MLLRPSTPSTTSSFAALWRALLREPLLHFVVLGGLVFMADDALRSRRPDPLQIVVSPEVDADARALFEKAQGRAPTASEMQVLRERWVANEVLYREGLALRLDQGDSTLRERVIFKALNVIESNLERPSADEATLRAWFERHRSRYETPARYDFSEALPTDTREETLRRFVRALEGGDPADVQSGLRIFKARPRDTIVDAFGAEFTEALDRMPLAEWQALPSKTGLRVVRLEARETAEAAVFEDVRERVLQDWKDFDAQERRTAAVRELTKKYTVKIGAGSS